MARITTRLYERATKAAELEKRRLAVKFRQERERRGLSARDVSDKVGCNPNTVLNVEKGRFGTTLPKFVAFYNK